MTCYGDHRSIGGTVEGIDAAGGDDVTPVGLFGGAVVAGGGVEHGNWGVPEEAGGAAVGGNLAGGPCLRPNPAAADCVFKGIGKA